MQQLERRESVALGQPHVLTEEEARWCVELRAALKQAGIPAPASDYELAIFALVGKADTAKSVQRVTRFNATVAKHGLDVRSDGAARRRQAARGHTNTARLRVDHGHAAARPQGLRIARPTPKGGARKGP